MKNIYSFTLGHLPELSFAEISEVLKYLNIAYSVIEFNKSFLLINTESEINSDFLIQKLGGTISIAKVEFQFNGNVDTDSMFDVFLEYIEKNFYEKKLKIGFSLYNFDAKFMASIKKSSFLFKKKLKEFGISTRIVTSKKDELSVVIINKEKLLKNGMAWQILRVEKGVMFAKVLSIFDYERFNKIDYSRPRVDARSGMMPPKLSKIMINLSDDENSIYDPFCGSGTILLMAGELNIRNIIGSDITAKAIDDASENLKWYEAIFDKKLNSQIFISDYKKLLDIEELKNKDFSIVTEGYLGEPLHGNESIAFIMNQRNDLENMYLDFFRISKELLQSGKSVVISFPVSLFKKETYYLRIIEKIESLGFEMQKLIEDKY